MDNENSTWENGNNASEVGWGEPTVQKKSTGWIIPVAVVGGVLLLAVLAGVFLLGNISIGSQETVQIWAKINEQGTAYIPLAKGNTIVIQDDVAEAVLTKDQKHVVVLQDNGTLYVTDKKAENKTEITSKCAVLRYVRNEGFFYEDMEGNFHRVLFKDYDSVKLGSVTDYAVAANTTSILYVTTDGGIYRLSSKGEEREKLGSVTDYASARAISDDGQTAVWITVKSGEQTIVLYEGDEKFTLGKASGEYGTSATFSKDQKMVVVKNYYSNNLWIKYVGQEPIKVTLGGENSGSVYTDKGYLADVKTSSVSYLYTAADSDTYFLKNVYSISKDGDREKLLSNVTDWSIANGYMVYKDEEGTLYYAKLNGSSLSEENRIANDVLSFQLTDNGKYVYYMNDYDTDGNTAAFYCYKIGSKKPQRITSEASCLNLSFLDYIDWIMDITCSADGKTVFFFKDLEYISDTYDSQGTLMMWSYGDKQPTKVSSEVLKYTLEGIGATGEVKKDGVMFMRFDSVDSNKNIWGNWMYYNGKKAVKIISDVIE